MRRYGSNSISLRAPASWEGCLDSGEVKGWLADYLRQPHPLPPDPGAGNERLFLSLPRRAVEALTREIGDTQSAALRRLIAPHLDGQSRTITTRVPVYRAEPVFDRPQPKPRTTPRPRPVALMEKPRAVAAPIRWTQAFEQSPSKTLASTAYAPISQSEAPPWVAPAHREEYLRNEAEMRAALLAEEQRRRAVGVTRVVVNGMITEWRPDIRWNSRAAMRVTTIRAEAAAVEEPPSLLRILLWLGGIGLGIGLLWKLWQWLQSKPEAMPQLAEASKEALKNLPNYKAWTPIVAFVSKAGAL